MQNPGDTGKSPPHVSEYMHRTLMKIPADASLREAGQLMAERGVGALLAVRGDQYVGIISEKRLAREAAAKGLDPETTRVQDVMRRDPISIESDRTVREAQDLMKARGVRHLVVKQAGEIVGIVSISDLIRYYTDFFEGGG